MTRSTNLVEQALAFQQVEQRLLQQGTIVTRQFRRVGLNRTFVVALAKAEETAAGLDLRLADQRVLVAARLGGRRQRHLLGLAALGDRLHCGHVAIADGDQKMIAVLAQQLLHAFDRIALIVEHMPDALDQLNVLRPVVAPAAAALHRLDLGEARLPETQHVLRQVEVFRDFADGAESVGALVHGPILHTGPQSGA
ncbi:hypothetical protein MPLDJ20_140340 [Mesorhizobium plurifarium]|uniref:Uncharacterized protein n=1 Tax=Mesorhizobium plurifarium TaxID=69974 RepID=A0A090GIA5_MESPL|nr:hypothetical protein MPLDJ20_140340 [Mesorhizobium plurifarium]